MIFLGRKQIAKSKELFDNFFGIRPDEKYYLFPRYSKVSLLACQHSKSYIYVRDYVIKYVCNSSVPEM